MTEQELDRKLEEMEKEQLERVLYPPELMWEISDDGAILRENYPGARDFTSVFWAIVQPSAALGFLIVGLSSLYGPLVDLTPFTAEYFGFLRPTPDINWIPQGAFMTFYGFFGFFLFGPLQWWLVFFNSGYGLAEFNKNTRRLTIIRDGELLKDLRFEDIEKVVFTWTNLAIGAREIYLMDTRGRKIDFMNTVEDLPKRVLERRASTLADFLEKELIVDDS